MSEKFAGILSFGQKILEFWPFELEFYFFTLSLWVNVQKKSWLTTTCWNGICCSEAMKNKQQQPKGKSTPRSSLGSPLASPSRKQVVSKAKGGSSPASRPAKKAATESTPKKTASPKKSTATTGATAAAASPGLVTRRVFFCGIFHNLELG